MSRDSHYYRKQDLYPEDWYDPPIANGGPYQIGNGINGQGVRGRRKFNFFKKKPPSSGKSVKTVFTKFANRTSLQGVPMIHKASRWYSKVFWSVIFFIATSAFTGHAYYIIANYLKFDTSTSVSITYAHADFPSITLCNINPLRASTVQNFGSENLVELIDRVEPITVNRYAERNVETSGDNGIGDESSGNNDVSDETSGNNGINDETSGNNGISDDSSGTNNAITTPSSGFNNIITKESSRNNAITEQSTVTHSNGYIETTQSLNSAQSTVTHSNINSEDITTEIFLQDHSEKEDIDETEIDESENNTSNHTDSNDDDDDLDVGDEEIVKRRKLLQVEDDFEEEYYDPYEYEYYDDESDFAAYDEPIDWHYVADTVYDYKTVMLDDSVATHVKINSALKEYTSEVPESNRTKMGHNLTMMLLSCSYDGMACSARNFTRRLDIEYGNCWTFNSAELLKKSLISRISGAKYGLDLLLFVNDAEYLKGFMLGRGIRLHIHPFRSMPFVADHGMSLKPGQEAYVSFRLVNQTRLGGRYGACDDKGTYKKYYNNTYDYTLLGCVNTCLERSISENCKCYRRTQRQYYSAKDLKTLKPCNTSTQLSCINKLNSQFMNRTLDCGCKQACHSQVYETSESYNIWPESGLWNALTSAVCAKDPEYCYTYFNKVDPSDFESILRRNFLHLKVYFKELNVQRIDETPAYPAPQFASDLGGCIGLWIGATFITVMELFEFAYQISTVCCRRKPGKAKSSADSFNTTSTRTSHLILRDAYEPFRRY